MKILWFTITPCSAAEKLSEINIKGGWLASLEKEISKKNDIELHIAFYHNKKMDSFKYNNTHFYPVYRKHSSSKIERYYSRLFIRERKDKTEIEYLLRLIEKIKPDLIHIHGTEENFGLIQDQINIPVVISIQGILSSIVEKFYTGIPDSVNHKFEKYKNKMLLTSAKYNFTKLKRKSVRERIILSTSKNIVGRTDYDRRITKLFSPESRYFTGQEILRPPFYTNQWKKVSFSSKISIVTILTDITYKGFETILKTSKILTAHENFNFEWLVAGVKHNSTIVAVSEAWLKIKTEKSNIKLLGQVNEKEIVDLLKSSDIYCQVSHIENSPNSLCEAMMTGMPCIASFAGGTGSMLENNKEGILVQDGDPYALAGAIVEMSSSFTLAREFGENARKRALTRHNKEQIVSDIINTYKSVIIA
jgi:glycosyltransferase involved in cell wall biosynthesis